MKNKRVAIIGAMTAEIDKLLAELELMEKTQIAGIDFYRGRLAAIDTIVCKCGVGKVNAAICAQVLIDRYQVENIIFTGVAGALAPELNIGDIVISTACRQHDLDASALGFAPGEIPYALQSVFAADDELVQLARNAAADIYALKVVVGTVLSGDQFIADRSKVQQLYQQFGGACVEMEGAAVAQTCAMNGVKFVVIRSMSDKADGSASVDFAEFTRQAAENSAKIVKGMLAQMRK